MTIRLSRTFAGEPQQQTQATGLYAQLAARFIEQQRQRVPRSTNSWGAEERRLGSWMGGVGPYRESGATAPRNNGEGRDMFDYSPEFDTKEYR